MNEVLWFLAGVVMGGLAFWLLYRAKVQHVGERVRSETAAERATLAAQLEGRQQHAEELKQVLQQRETRIAELQTEVTVLREKQAQLLTAAEEQARQAEEKLALVDDAQQKLSDAFQALASEALKSNNQSFLELAKATLEKTYETAKGDLEKRHQAIGELLTPVRQSLDKVDTKIHELERARTGAYEALREQVRGLVELQSQLRTETSNLAQALRRPSVRGRWGEMQLRRVVEMAGMLAHCDFHEQQSADTEQGRQRPDLVVRLPGNKNIVVDAKAPLAAYLEAIEAPDHQQREARLREHAAQVRSHMVSLGRKSYWENFQPAPEFVVLFLPGEPFFSAALDYDPALIEVGVDQGVILATPTTLIALLRAVAYGWRQERLAENAREISELGQDLYKRLSDLGKHMARLGSGLDRAITAYNSAVGTLESRVLVSARRFKDLGAAPDDAEIERIEPIEHAPRGVQASELLPFRDADRDDVRS